MNIIADLHTHTVACSHAYSTVGENCRAAAQKGLLAVACTDHGPQMPDSPHSWHFESIGLLPRRLAGVTLLRGMEANILSAAGETDIPAKAPFDFVIASMHMPVFPPCGYENHTRAWLAVCDNPQVDCLGHPGHPDFIFDYEKVARRCLETHTAVEVNSSASHFRPASLPTYEKLIRVCAGLGVPVLVNSDAHHESRIGDCDKALSFLESIQFPEELILNADWDRLKRWFAAKGNRNLDWQQN